MGYPPHHGASNFTQLVFGLSSGDPGAARSLEAVHQKCIKSTRLIARWSLTAVAQKCIKSVSIPGLTGWAKAWQKLTDNRCAVEVTHDPK
jgi:hypothetical protein